MIKSRLCLVRVLSEYLKGRTISLYFLLMLERLSGCPFKIPIFIDWKEIWEDRKYDYSNPAPCLLCEQGLITK